MKLCFMIKMKAKANIDSKITSFVLKDRSHRQAMQIQFHIKRFTFLPGDRGLYLPSILSSPVHQTMSDLKRRQNHKSFRDESGKNE